MDEVIYSNDIEMANESEDTGNEDDHQRLIGAGSNLRRRKGKIMSCAKETIENASRQLRRRVPYAGHLMTPRRLWLTKIPTQCDVVIEFPENAPDDALKWLLQRIRTDPPGGLGLQANVKSHESSNRTAFYVSAPFDVLCRAAEEARLPKRLRTDLGGALREFTSRERHCFAKGTGDENMVNLFTSQERQWLVLQVLQGLRAGKSDLEILTGQAAVDEGQSIVAAWQQSEIITQIFPLHETTALNRLQSQWVRKLFAAQPLDDIADYFGVKVALYFAWLGHYTCALIVPAIFGTILWAALWNSGQTIQDMGHVLFSLFNVAWASLYLEAWRRYSVELAFRWGTLSTPPELLEPPRPLYKGPLVESNVTGRLEPKEAPAWQRRAFRYFISFPIIGLCLAMVFVVMFVMLQLQDWLDHHLPDMGFWNCMCMSQKDWADSKLPESGLISCLSVVPKVMLAGAITLMDEAYFKLAVWLNDKENYRLQSKYENHLIAKVALFQFVNSFLSLFYIAFYLRDQEKLKEQLAGLLISRQIIGNLRESAFPYFMEQLKLANLSFRMWGALSPTQETVPPIGDGDVKSLEQELKEAKEASEPIKRNIGQAEIESSLYKYDGTFSDHLEMLVQMGYVVLFSAAFPLAGVCALANNFLEIRSDAFKLAHVHQRPFGQRVANIGTWQNALGILGLAAVIVNCALIGLSGQVSRLWPGLTSAQTIMLIVALEHIMLGLRSALTWLLPELPSWLAAEIARAEHCRREMQCRGPSPRASPPSPPSTISLSHVNGTPDVMGTGGDQSVGSDQVAEDIIFHHIAPMSPKLKQNSHNPTPLSQSLEADTSNFTANTTPESPPSHKTSLSDNLSHMNLEIPPYSGSGRPTSHPIQIPEIPPFRKQNHPLQHFHHSHYHHPPHQQPQTAIVNPSPSRIADIPPFKPRKTSAESEYQLNVSAGQGAGHHHNPEWMKRLKGSETSTIHRSVDCIPNKELAVPQQNEPLKGAPSWSHVAISANESNTSSSTTVPTTNKSQSPTATDDELKALADAKKSRVKQSLIKRARSVAIFSLKLKERRAREAEKAHNLALEQAKVINPAPPGGELDLIGIEQLIQIDDVIQNKNAANSGTL